VSYNAIYETAMNESSGNATAQNNSDSNAAAGNPSEGLMQTTQTTFDAYALSGYNDIWNPVDNIIAAVIYAQGTYGGLDTVVANRCGGSCWYGY
jgi:SLT domain-containing protein